MIRPAQWLLIPAVLLILFGCDRFQSKNIVDPQPNGYDDLRAKAREAETRPVKTDSRADSKTGAAVQPVPERQPEAPVTGEATAPRKCYELYRQAIKNRDFDACWGLLSGPSKDAYETAASDLKMRVINSPTPSDADMEVLGVMGLTKGEKDLEKFNGKMFLSGSMLRQANRDPEAMDEITRTEFDHESIYEAKATVYIKIRGQRQPEGMKLLRESGLWHIEMRPQRPSN